jgi:hypothetical protein
LSDRQVTRLAEAAWDDFVAGAEGATPFHGSAWLAAAARAGGGEACRLGVYDGSHLVAGLAGVERDGALRTPDLLPHSGLLFRRPTSDRPAHIESERSAATEAAANHLAGAFARVHVTHPPTLLDVRPFQWAGWQVHPRFTYTIDLPEDRQIVWDRFERRTRTAIRKAGKEGCRVEATEDVDELRRLYGMVYGDESRAPVGGAYLQSLAQEALAGGMAEGWRCLTAGGQTASVVLFVHGADGTLYAWVAGADPAHRDTGATSLLYWTVLESSAATSFDFVGANLPAVAFFKRGFGGDLRPYYATRHERSRLRRLLTAWRG